VRSIAFRVAFTLRQAETWSSVRDKDLFSEAEIS
jgi:hypothetical protein